MLSFFLTVVTLKNLILTLYLFLGVTLVLFFVIDIAVKSMVASIITDFITLLLA